MMQIRRAESALEMAERHVLEGKARLARQRDLVRTLENAGYGDIAVEARAFLGELERWQASTMAHLLRQRSSEVEATVIGDWDARRAARSGAAGPPGPAS